MDRISNSCLTAGRPFGAGEYMRRTGTTIKPQLQSNSRSARCHTPTPHVYVAHTTPATQPYSPASRPHLVPVAPPTQDTHPHPPSSFYWGWKEQLIYIHGTSTAA